MLRKPHDMVIPERLLSGILLTTKEYSRKNPAGMTIPSFGSYIKTNYQGKSRCQ